MKKELVIWSSIFLLCFALGISHGFYRAYEYRKSNGFDSHVNILSCQPALFSSKTRAYLQNHLDMQVNVQTVTSFGQLLAAFEDKSKRYDVIICYQHWLEEEPVLKLLRTSNKLSVDDFNAISTDFLRSPSSEIPALIPILWNMDIFLKKTTAPSKSSLLALLKSSELKGKILLNSDPHHKYYLLKELDLLSGSEDKTLSPDLIDKIVSQNIPNAKFVSLQEMATMVKDAQLLQLPHGIGKRFAQKNPNFTIFTPEEGVYFWMESVALFINPENEVAAEKFLKTLLDENILVNLASQTGLATTLIDKDSIQLGPEQKSSFVRQFKLSTVRPMRALPQRARAMVNF